MESDFLTNPELLDGSQGCKDDAENIHLKLPKPNNEDEKNNKQVSSVTLNNVQLPLEPIHSGSVNNILGDGDFYVKRSDLDSFESRLSSSIQEELRNLVVNVREQIAYHMNILEEKDTLGSELMVFEDKMCEMMDDKLSKGYCAISEMVEKNITRLVSQIKSKTSSEVMQYFDDWMSKKMDAKLSATCVSITEKINTHLASFEHRILSKK